MVDGIPKKRARQLRADGRRNMLSLLEAATACFAEHGAAASLEQIAHNANVGIGTLYRHFPTRDALVAAILLQDINRLNESAFELAKSTPPLAALRAWLILFIDFLETKHNLGAELETLIGNSDDSDGPYTTCLSPTIHMLVKANNKNPETRIAVTPLDLLRAILGVATIRSDPQWKEHSIKIVDLLLRADRMTY